MTGPNWIVIGFDRRRLPFMTTFRFTTAQAIRHVDLGPPYPATRSPEVWPRPANVDEIPSTELNEFNLLHLPEEAEEPSVTVAFSVDKSVLDSWPREPYVLPVPELYLFAERGWRVLGYDIVDGGLQMSALYDTYALTPAVIDAMGVGNDLLNCFGLIPSLELASKLKLHLDVVGPEFYAYYEVVKVLAKLNTPL